MSLFIKSLLIVTIVLSSQLLFAHNDYVTILVRGPRSEVIFISVNGEEYNVIEPSKGEENNYADYNKVIKIVQGFEDKGYKVLSTTRDGFASGTLFFLLVRENE
ncbi:MAG: hypothetical protein WD048_13550 [Chitinophagales bacterium]